MPGRRRRRQAVAGDMDSWAVTGVLCGRQRVNSTCGQCDVFRGFFACLSSTRQDDGRKDY